MTLSQDQINGVIAFHGHYCPGLAFGLRVGDWARQEFGFACDEEIVAVVESDMCAVDAIQFLVGCTFGKGNLIFLDYGKNAYSFFRRCDGKNVRLMTHGGLLHDLREEQRNLPPQNSDAQRRIHKKMIERIMKTKFEDIFSITPAQVPMPQEAPIHPSIRCDGCGELVMSTRLFCDENGKNLCIPCRAEKD